MPHGIPLFLFSLAQLKAPTGAASPLSGRNLPKRHGGWTAGALLPTLSRADVKGTNASKPEKFCDFHGNTARAQRVFTLRSTHRTAQTTKPCNFAFDSNVYRPIATQRLACLGLPVSAKTPFRTTRAFYEDLLI